MCDLLGHRRRYGVAMDNREQVAGYKVYEDPETGVRPAVFVAFLDLVGGAGAAVNGVLLPVSGAEIEALDRRERNYRRVEVSGLVTPRAAGRVWTYVGSPDGRARFEAGLGAGAAVVGREYRDGVESGFRALGEDEWRRYLESTDESDIAMRSLRQIDLPASTGM